MKKSIFKALVFTLFLFGTEKGISQNSDIEISDLNTTDELFKIKNTINENNSVDFLKHFYVVSLVENISKNDELIFALNNIIKKENFTCSDLINKKVENFIKNCKSKSDLLKEIESNFEASGSFIEAGAEGGIKNFTIEKLTDEVYAINSRACGSGAGYHDQFVLISDFETDSFRFIQGDEFINGIMFTAKRKLEDFLKVSLHEQKAKVQTYGKATINGEEYITLPYFEGENIGGFQYNLIIAYNFKTNKFYYLYDSRKSEKDNWKQDKEDIDFQFYTWVTEKNPNWKSLN